LAKDSSTNNRLKSIEEQLKSMADHNIRLTVVETTLPQIRDELREIKDLLRSHSS
jgi:pyruvate-formate lyase-activating enzyme